MEVVMKISNALSLGTLLGCLTFSSGAFASIDINAPVVKLRTDCTESGVTLNNCFTKSSDLTYWMANTRTPKPSVNSPVRVEIGPGIFGGLILGCDPAIGYTGYISFVGAGRGQTTIQGTSVTDISKRPISAFSCTNLNFSDLEVRGLNYMEQCRREYPW